MKKMNTEMLKWLKAAGIRAVKTVAQTAVGMLSGEMLGIMEADWLAVLSVSAMAGVVSLLTSVAGLPELKE
ncbi:MAG: holin [Clostridia bacterium]|nr:holin [Clostridia bacterium]